MSKRKGRKPARSSEIKSVLRAPPDGENELEPGAEADADTLPLDVLAEVVEPESAPQGAPDEDAPESEPAPPVESAPAPRPRRLRAVGADDTAALDGDEEALALDDEVDDSEPSGERGGGGGDANDGAADRDEGDDEADDEEPLEPPPLGAEGDDTEGFLRGLIEALLFTSQKPIDLKDLARSAGVDKPRAKELLEQLMASYDGRGLCIEQVAGGFVMRSSPRYAPYIQKILALRPVRLSRAQLETLAIVAYRQPVTKPEVDDIRGVDSGQVIKGLLERSLLKMLGKKDEPGHPTLYGTTNDFLELLNLQSLKDLPTLREYTELSEESQRKFLDETGEPPPSGAISFERPASTGAEGSGSEVAEDGAQPGAEAAPEGGDDGASPQPTDEARFAEDDAPNEMPSAAEEDDSAGASDDDEAPHGASEEGDEDEDATSRVASDEDEDDSPHGASNEDDEDEDEDDDDEDEDEDDEDEDDEDDDDEDDDDEDDDDEDDEK